MGFPIRVWGWREEVPLESFDRGPLARLKDPFRPIIWRFGRLHQSPILVLGIQKSGTTAIGASLAAHLDVPATRDPFYRIGDFTLEDRVFSGELPLARFIAAHRRFFRQPLIKEPSFTFFDQELRQVFPRATFLFVVRDPGTTSGVS